MKNLWEETIEILNSAERTFDDVEYICGKDFSISKENFEKVAKETDYDPDYGAQEVAYDLKIFGKDFIMTRGEYDGSEWWNFEFTKMITPKEIKRVKRLSFVSGWNTLAKINDEKYIKEIMS